MKERILDVVDRLIKSKGIKGFTMDDISKELHIGKQTIYSHFKNKDELIAELVRTSIEDNKVLTESAVAKASGIKKKLHAAAISYHKFRIPLELLEEIKRVYPDLWEVLEEQRNFKLKIIMSILEEGIQNGELSKEVDKHIIYYVLDKVTNAFLNDEFLHEKDMTLNQALESLTDLLFYGMIAR